jgi:OmcA/MtrC family decaheme c-type cytochrome
MEFEYPQSMANCNTCHGGKLDKILTDNNFVLETCKSCHAVTGSAQAQKPQPALADVVPHTLTGREDCYRCHAGLFKEVTGHTGYDKVIYGTDNGVKYSDVIKVTIDNASFDNTNKLTISFSSTGTLGGLVTPNIKPTVMVGLYGYDTKDYIVGPHERSIDSSRDLEYAVGATHPRFTTDNTVSGGKWKVTADLSTWAGMIADGSVKRLEIGVMPRLQNADNVVVALNAPSRTFDLKTKKFVDDFYPAIVTVEKGCNNCHDALATTFHSADRGGNIVVCRLCHITKSGGSHLEMQSRSIDSYAHAIHTFQDFDIGDIDFDNNVQSMFHDLKIETTYPTFGTTNCVSCHNAGTFNVPDQAKSLAGILSASDDVAGRTLNDVPAYVTGPASRACGACHRAELIKEDAAGEFASFNQHTQDGGYLLVPGDLDTLIRAINVIMPPFNDGVMVVLP